MTVWTDNSLRQRPRGFTLVELLVVIGIISVLVSLLMPMLSKARARADAVVCASNLRQCYTFMLMYQDNNHGWMYPPGLGAQPTLLPEDRWPNKVFVPPQPNPPQMICPNDKEPGIRDLDPLDKHSYILNNHLIYQKIRYTTRSPKYPIGDVVLMGEKVNGYRDYYMEIDDTGTAWGTPGAISDYDRLVELYRHGMNLGSNVLFMDSSVRMVPSQSVLVKRPGCIDPWEPEPGALGNAATQPSVP